MTDKIVVRYDQMDSAALAMKEIANVIDAKLDTLRSALSNMDWQGGAREEYWQYQLEWDAAVNELNALLNRIGATVGQINQNYLDTEMQIKRRWATR